MRRLTLGALILGGGTLLALPFRRPALPDPTPVDGRSNQTKSHLLDDESLQLLVQEVTRDVQVPVVYHPHTDYSPAPAAAEIRQMPLTYEDLAVPVDRDPFYESRFNASANIASNTTNTGQTQRIAELERVFAETKFVDESISNFRTGISLPQAIPSNGKQWVFRDERKKDPADANSPADFPSRRRTMDAQFASSESLPEPGTGESSILKQLPPPEDSKDRSIQPRQRQWIVQPD